MFDNRQLAILWKLVMARSERVHYDENVIHSICSQPRSFLVEKEDGALCNIHPFRHDLKTEHN